MPKTVIPRVGNTTNLDTSIMIMRGSAGNLYRAIVECSLTRVLMCECGHTGDYHGACRCNYYWVDQDRQPHHCNCVKGVPRNYIEVPDRGSLDTLLKQPLIEREHGDYQMKYLSHGVWLTGIMCGR